MTTQVLTGYYATRYHLDAPVTTLSIAATGYLFGGLVGGAGQYQVINSGGIYGVTLSDASTVDNLGTIKTTYRYGAAVELGGGGTLVNGSASDTSALVLGGTSTINNYHQGANDLAVYVGGAPGSVANYGTLETRPGGNGVFLDMGGSVTNGSAADHAALITSGNEAVDSYAAATVTNFGTITSKTKEGVEIEADGVVFNGSSTDTTALISGGVGMYGGTVTNDGVIIGTAGPGYGGVGMATGTVINGSATDTVASITGYEAVGFYTKSGTVFNDGTLSGAGGPEERGKTPSGAFLYDGGSVTNGASNDTKALIEGYDGVTSFGRATGTVRNFGTILGGSTYFCVAVQLGVGSFTNGSATDLTATIEAYTALGQGRYGYSLGASGSDPGALTATNFGTIIGAGEGLGPVGLGANLYTSGSRLTNGSSADHTALVTGVDGVIANDGCTLTNYGIIDGTSGSALQLNGVTARVNAEAGSKFEGTVSAGGGAVDVVGGVGDMTALISVGRVEGAGTLALSGGVSVFGIGASLLVAAIDVSGAATGVDIEAKLGDARVWDQTGATLTVGSGYSMNFTGAGDVFSGTLAGAGAVAFAGGSDLLSGVTLDAAKISLSKAKVTLSGQVDLVTALSDLGGAITIANAGASLTGGGKISLSDSAANTIEGASSSAQLTDVNDLIEGAGQLGDGKLKLTLDKGAVVKSDTTVALVLDTGSNALANTGLVAADSSGGLIIDGAVSNTGTLEAVSGTLTVGGAVTGTGLARIAGGTAVFDAAFTQNVTFTTAGGKLVLAKSQSYTGAISGFADGGETTLDLEDISFGSKTKATFSGTATSGVLTVTDGTHVSRITFAGNFTGVIFNAVSDGHGGTDVTGSIAPGPAAASLAAAMAGFSPGASAGELGAGVAGAPPPRLMLVAHG